MSERLGRNPLFKDTKKRTEGKGAVKSEPAAYECKPSTERTAKTGIEKYSGQQWEYCILNISLSAFLQRDFSVTYISINGESRTKRLFNDLRKATPDMFNTAFGLLGATGWELVSVQNGWSSFGGIKKDEIVAYFKRPFLEGRNIEEQDIILSN